MVCLGYVDLFAVAGCCKNHLFMFVIPVSPDFSGSAGMTPIFVICNTLRGQGAPICGSITLIGVYLNVTLKRYVATSE